MIKKMYELKFQKLISIAVFIVSGFSPLLAHAQSTTWTSEFRFPGTFFPSFAISSAGKDSKGPIDNNQAYGYLNSSSFAVKITNLPIGSKVKVEIAIPEIGISGELESSTSTSSEPKVIAPRLSFSQDRLTKILQPQSSEIIFRVYINGALDREEKKPLRIRAITDAPLKSCKEPSKCQDYSTYIAAYVNENHPAIDNVLRAALNIPAIPVKNWTGTQGTEQDVMQQVWAIWYLFQRSKVTYSSITTVSDQLPNISSQTIRPLSQSLRTAQANCIDGTVLFSSILRKIGIEPIIVLIPGHAFLGFFVDKQQQHPIFLETTMINNPNNPFYQKGPTPGGENFARMLGSDVHMKQSWGSFIAAINEGGKKYNEAAPNFGKNPGYILVPVIKARKDGILPLPL
ncbi:hypothetical protein [Undibacterium sp. Xuan67W]|uniref:hypothetical protein n=1 Tax=Undibacterium sp. Xuan67W TaxID=3413057 RepID=UPI003BF37547